MLAILAYAADARAWCRMTTSSAQPTPGMPCVTEGIPLEWKRRCMEYSIDARGSSELSFDTVSEIVARGFGAWLAFECPEGGKPGFEIRETEQSSMCDRAQYNTEDGNVNTIAFVSAMSWGEREYDPSAYALTTVWHNTRTGEIYDADMEINEGRGPYGICPPLEGCTDGTVDLQNVVTHEAGHFFGLGHTTLVTSVMYYTSDPGEVDKRIPRTDDIEGFCAIYPPGSLPSACDFTPRHGLDLDCGDDGCGCSAPGSTGRGAPWWLLLVAVSAGAFRARRIGRAASR